MTDVLTLGRITILALADSVNPCALAMLAMILMEILIQTPEKKRRVLFAGFAFSIAVFLSYLFYGTILITFFKGFVDFLRGNSVIFYDAIAGIAILLGILNLKDFFFYKKGSFATEMPLWMRPRAKRIIEKITSPAGAFVTGIVITTFLLPCTLGPYVVASGLLSQLGIIGALPWLMYYNLIFILPMIIITLIIYFGFREVEQISGWRDRNIRILHLIAGILLVVVGASLLMGWL